MDNLAVHTSPWIALAVVLCCLALSAVFSAAETALTAASRARMMALENNGDAQAAAVNRLLARRERFIGTVLIGNSIVNIGASAFTTSVLVGLFGAEGVIVATVAMSALVIVFAEVLPKTLAIASPDRAALSLARVTAFFVAMLGPITAAVNALVRLIIRPFGVRIGANQAVLSAHEEIMSTVDILHKEGGVARADRDMLGGLIELNHLVVSDIMVHRTKMSALDLDLPPRELVRQALASANTRLPLWRDEPENIVGVLHAKDLLRALYAAGGDADRLDVAAIAAKPWYVPDTTSLKDQLNAFLQRKTHFALVVDEYGVVQGLVTLEDILEEIVGDIRDEHDMAAIGVRVQADGSVLVDGGAPIRDLNRVMDWKMPDDEATTVAGLVIHEAMTIPEVRQVFTFHGFRFEILRKTRNRITYLKVTPAPRLAAGVAPGDDDSG